MYDDGMPLLSYKRVNCCNLLQMRLRNMCGCQHYFRKLKKNHNKLYETFEKGRETLLLVTGRVGVNIKGVNRSCCYKDYV